MLIPLQHALYMLGEEAVATTPGSHAQEVQGECRKLAEEFGNTKVRVSIPAADLFAYAVEGMRQRGDTDAVAALERLIALIKSGDKRKVVGTMTLGVRDERELDAALGKLRERAIIIGNGDEPG